MTEPVEEDRRDMPEGVTEDRRKNGSGTLKEHVDKRMDRFQVNLYKFYAFFAAIVVAAALAFAVVIANQGETSQDIQDQRFDSLVKLCEDQNTRHDEAFERVRKLFPPPERFQRFQLIDAILPYKDDCTVDARERVRKG